MNPNFVAIPTGVDTVIDSFKTIEFKTPPLPTNAEEWSNHIAAFQIAKNCEFVADNVKANRARDIARDAVAIFIDRTTSSTAAATDETTIAKCVVIAKAIRSLAEK